VFRFGSGFQIQVLVRPARNREANVAEKASAAAAIPQSVGSSHG